MRRYPLRLGIVGCGAVVEALHLPASLMVSEVDVVALVDRNASRAHSLAARFGVPLWFDNHRALAGRVDAVLVATPPAVHAPVACDLLSRGVHVLCEKPLAPTTADCRRMLEAAQSGDTTLATAHSRRFHFNLSQLKVLLDLGVFGSVYHLRAQDGFVFSWSTQTGYMFQGGTASGVVLENGIHVLDTVLWLLGCPEAVIYRDDFLGGVESNAELTLRFARGVTAALKISRTAKLTNYLEIYGELGWARCDLYEGQNLELYLPHSKIGQNLGAIAVGASCSQDGQMIMAAQLADFAQSVVEQRRPKASAEDGFRAVELVEQCYAQRSGRPVPDRAPLPGMVLR